METLCFTGYLPFIKIFWNSFHFHFCSFIYLYLTNNLTNLQFVKKERLAIHKIEIVRLIKVKSKVKVNVTKTF